MTDKFYKVESFGRTLYHLLGIDPDTIVHTPGNRPIKLIAEEAPLIRKRSCKRCLQFSNDLLQSCAGGRNLEIAGCFPRRLDANFQALVRQTGGDVRSAHSMSVMPADSKYSSGPSSKNSSSSRSR